MARDERAHGREEPPREFDSYRLIRPIGSGHMGEVWLAHDVLLDRPVALKFVATRYLTNDTIRDRFLVEARAVARLQHPNIVAVHRVGDVDGRLYIVTEFIRGQGLDRLPKPMPWIDVLDLAVGIARGLSAAHRRGVLHRDIKPANVVLSDSGDAKLVDFGLAKLGTELPAAGTAETVRDTALMGQLTTASGDNRLTEAGVIMGTPAFMAPELWSFGVEATCQSDIYSLGMVLYELCSGQLPGVDLPVLELARQRQRQDLPSVKTLAPALDPRLAAIIDRCVSRDPAARYQTAEQLLHVLEQLRTPARGAPVPEGNPYRGLRTFEPEHRGLFFGRGPEIRDVIERLRTDPFVLVTGDSGVGKSSLCRAGILPTVAEAGLGGDQAWTTVTLIPGKRPMERLLAALQPHMSREESALLSTSEGMTALSRRRAGTPILLFVDQLEELVTLSEAEEARRFSETVNDLANGFGRFRLLATVRHDFLTRVAQLPGLGERITEALFLLRPLTPLAIREAVVGPAQLHGVTFESEAFIQELVDAAAGSTGGLPLFQFALAQLWEARDPSSTVLRASALAGLGGAEGALARHADSVLRSLPLGERKVAREVLLQLITSDLTRARRTGRDLGEDDAVTATVLRALVRGRLLVASEGDEGTEYEIAHEALIRGWTTLKDWLDQEVESRAIHERLRAAAAEWERLGHARELLWGPRQLAEVDALDGVSLHAREQRFVQASRRALDRRRQATRGGLALAFFALLATVGVTVRLNYQEHRRVLDGLEEQGRQELIGGDSLRGLAYLAEAFRLGAESAPLRFLLAQASNAVELRIASLEGHESWIRSVAYARDGSRIVTGSEDGTARLWSHTGAALAVLKGHKGGVWSASFSNDGKRVVTASSDKTARIWDAQTGAPVLVLTGHEGELRTAAFSPDDRHIATSSVDGTARIWDAASGRLEVTLRGHEGRLRLASFSADGKRVLTCAGDGTARLWDAASGRELVVLHAHTGPVWVAQLDPSGRYVLTAGEDRTPKLWDAQTGKLLYTLIAHTGAVYSGQFSPDGKHAVTAGQDGTAKVWDTATGQLVASLERHLRPIRSVAFSADGTRVVTASQDATAVIWDALHGRRLVSLEGHTGETPVAEFSPDGNEVVTGSWDKTARIWNARAEKLRHLMQPVKGHVSTVTFDRAGQRLASTSDGGTARVWDVAAGRPLFPAVQGGALNAGDLSADGKWLVTAGADGTATLFDAASGKIERSFDAHAGPVWHAVFSHDGRWIATAGDDGVARVWDLATGAIVQQMRHPQRLYQVSFAPANDLLATASVDGAVRLWSMRDGQLVRVLRDGATVLCIHFSPDGKRLVTTSERPAVQIWSVDRGVPLLSLETGADYIATARFAPDGERVITASETGTGIWDSRNGKRLARLDGASIDASFSPDGALAAIAWPEEILLWDVHLSRRTRAEAAWLGRQTPYVVDEGRVYLAGPRDR